MNTRDFWLSAWSWNTATVASALLAIVVYLYLGRRRTRSGTAWFCAAVLVFLLTLVSPMNILATGYLFSAHMAQHLLLLLVVPALALLGLPQKSADRQPRRPTSLRFLTHPVPAWLAGVGAMWLWHAPNLCSAAASNRGVHVLQVISLLGLGTLFWFPILRPDLPQRLSPPAGMVYLFTACLGCTALGIIITFAPLSVCPVFMHPPDTPGILSLIRKEWGITPELDQQIGGLLMWVPSCSIYILGILALLARWYSGSEPESLAHEAPQPSSTNG